MLSILTSQLVTEPESDTCYAQIKCEGQTEGKMHRNLVRRRRKRRS